MQNNSTKGAKVCLPLTLRLYDWWVLSLSNSFAWRCQTDGILPPHFRRHRGEHQWMLAWAPVTTSKNCSHICRM